MLVCDGVAELLALLDDLVIEARLDDLDAPEGVTVGLTDVLATRLELND